MENYEEWNTETFNWKHCDKNGDWNCLLVKYNYNYYKDKISSKQSTSRSKSTKINAK